MFGLDLTSLSGLIVSIIIPLFDSFSDIIARQFGVKTLGFMFILIWLFSGPLLTTMLQKITREKKKSYKDIKVDVKRTVVHGFSDSDNNPNSPNNPGNVRDRNVKGKGDRLGLPFKTGWRFV